MDRIENHPILGETPKGKKVTFSFDGNILEGYGITPDVDAVFSEDNYSSGIDNQLMTAIEIIKAH